ncbi:MAG: FkbM family methyltransferase [Thermomicrobiales bacterium]|nr:FkbM family methyltransferase [Thermomicrobiales bacterium]
MNTGQDTCYYLARGYEVIGIEADPRLVDECKQDFQQDITSGRLTVIEGAIAPVALGDHIRLFTNELSVWNSIDEQWANSRGSVNSVAVPRVDLESVIRDHGLPVYMKIDIEGADEYALSVLRETDLVPPMLSVESNKTDYELLRKEIEALSDLGYIKFRAVQQAWVQKTQIAWTDSTGTTRSFRFLRDSSGPFGDDLRQPWRSKDEVLSDYRAIFDDYRRWGDGSCFARSAFGSNVVAGLSKLVRRPLAGWYDTHCML